MTTADADTNALKGDNFFSSRGNLWSVAINGLENRSYSLFIYAPSDTSVSTRPFTVNEISEADTPGSTNPGLVEGVDYVVVNNVFVTNGTITMTAANNNGFGGLAGVQLVAAAATVPEAGTGVLVLAAPAALLALGCVRRRRA